MEVAGCIIRPPTEKKNVLKHLRDATFYWCQRVEYFDFPIWSIFINFFFQKRGYIDKKNPKFNI